MIHHTPIAAAFTALFILAAADAQGRGRRGPPEAVRTRAGAYFVDVELPAVADKTAGDKKKKGSEFLAATDFVKKTRGKNRLALVYLFDPEGDEKKHDRFEQSLFNHADLNVALRLFCCGRVDLSKNENAMARFGKKAPLFVVFDVQGKVVGEVSMKGYKPANGPLIAALKKVSKGHSKLALASFVKKYKSFLNDLTQIENKKSALQSKRDRAENKDGGASKAKLAKLDKDDAALSKSEDKLLASETKLLEKAKAPDRDTGAERVGARRWGRGR